MVRAARTPGRTIPGGSGGGGAPRPDVNTRGPAPLRSGAWRPEDLPGPRRPAPCEPAPAPAPPRLAPEQERVRQANERGPAWSPGGFNGGPGARPGKRGSSGTGPSGRQVEMGRAVPRLFRESVGSGKTPHRGPGCGRAAGAGRGGEARLSAPGPPRSSRRSPNGARARSRGHSGPELPAGGRPHRCVSSSNTSESSGSRLPPMSALQPPGPLTAPPPFRLGCFSCISDWLSLATSSVGLSWQPFSTKRSSSPCDCGGGRGPLGERPGPGPHLSEQLRAHGTGTIHCSFPGL